MDKSKAPPLQNLVLASRPLTPHAIAWSCDAELAVATAEGIHVFLPEYPRSGDGGVEKPASERYATFPQFSLFLQTSGSLRPDPLINAQLCLFAGVKELPPQQQQQQEQQQQAGGAASDGAAGFHGVGSGRITGAGAALGQIIRVEWSPSGLGNNLRPVLAALTAHGAITCFGEHHGGSGPLPTITQARSFKNWRTLWGLGASMPLPIPVAQRRGEAAPGTDVEILDERITSFSWAREILPGRALLAYATDDEEVAIMAVQFYSRDSAPDDEKGWDIQEVARFDASGPHMATDELDPDFTASGSAFSLKWSPWVTQKGTQTSTLSYIADNHVGFRRITIEELWKRGEIPSLTVEDHDTKGICLSLSTDAFLEWENIPWNDDGIFNMRGIIATPFVLHPFQIPLTGPLSAPIPRHATTACSTTYPNQEVPITNPITGLVIHHADPENRPPVPLYSLVRQSCTATNQDWFQTTLPEDANPIPQWAEDLGQRTVRRISLFRALRGKDIDSDSDSDSEGGGGGDGGDGVDQEQGRDSSNTGDLSAGAVADADVQMREPDTEKDNANGEEPRVHPRRFRLWGLAASPGDGCTAAVVSKYSTQHPARRDRAEVMFGWHVPGEGDGGGDDAGAAAAAGASKPAMRPARATTEARVWEWLYGRGSEVPGTTNSADIILLSSSLSTLRGQFRHVMARMGCVFCDARLRENGAEAVCENGHAFATCASSGMPIMAPGISRVCAVCGLRCLTASALRKLAEGYLDGSVQVDTAGELCGGCGGKFIA